MKPFVILDNWHGAQPATRFEAALERSGLPVALYRTNHDEFPASTQACGVFVGPSRSGAYEDDAWIRQEHEVLRRFAQAGVPMLGLCFGSQVLASALLGPEQVFKRGNRETGCAEIEFTPAGPVGRLTKACPSEVNTFHWHPRPHPEMNREQICEFLENNREWFLSEGKDVDTMIRNSEDNEQFGTVFDRFLSIVLEYASGDSAVQPQPT